MIETHCHLTDPRLGDQLAAILDRARAAGVDRIITIATSLPDSDAVVALCKSEIVAASGVTLRCTVGVHPAYLDRPEHGPVDETGITRIRDLLSDPRVAAMGEIGLDYFHCTDVSSRQLQRKLFARLLSIAASADMPVVIHCRDAVDDTLEVMREAPRVSAVFHCFTGTVAEAHKILDAGYYLGFTGVVTFKKSDELRAIAAAAPPDRILVETDAPYLTPEPVRKIKVNEPAFVMHVARAVADARNITVEQLDDLTTANALRLFRWNQT
jgi:TatD DNase family protein